MTELELEFRVLASKAHVPFPLQFSEIKLEYRVEPPHVQKLFLMQVEDLLDFNP